jgi:putative spermidine/putrescine transport system substrate-binding protein
MFARMNGGSEKAIDPGFKVMKEQVNPNVLAYEPSPGKMTELFQSGQAVIAVWGTGRVHSFAVTGFPVDFVYPKEGTVTLLSSVCPIAKPGQSPVAHEFVKAMIEPGFQALLAKEYGYGPVNRKTTINAASLPMSPVGDRAAKLLNVDWDVINDKRDEWTKRWNREVER